MEKRKPGWKQKLILLVASSLSVIAVLLAGEFYCRRFTRINFLDNSRELFAANRFGQSYGNEPNAVAYSFGEKVYIDADGFRISEQEFAAKNALVKAANGPAILIAGDSVAFGVGLKEEDSFAGRLRRALPGETIYNSAAIGYDAFDYKTVVEAVVAQKPEIKTVVQFYCLNDISAGSAKKILQLTNQKNGIDAAPETEPDDYPVIRPINDFLRSRSKLYIFLKNALRDTQLVTFKSDYERYQTDATVEAALKPLGELEEELTAAGIRYKVFILPYEAQLRPKSPAEYLLPQKKAADVMRREAIDYYDMTPDFQKSGVPAQELYLYGDPMHLSAKGSALAAEIVARELKN